MGIFSWIVLGLITGWVAGKIVHKTGSGMRTDMALGVVGAIVGGFLAGQLGLGGGDNIGRIIVAIIGAVVVLLVYDVLEAYLPKFDRGFVELVSNLTAGIPGTANSAEPGDPLDSRSDIDAVARQPALGIFDHIAQMNADAKFDATARHARGAARRDGHAAKRDDRANFPAVTLRAASAALLLISRSQRPLPAFARKIMPPPRNGRGISQGNANQSDYGARREAQDSHERQ
jgi:uncharacterized membrane protein YeaQ/YmgE (transglycosylase-associated protein family)